MGDMPPTFTKGDPMVDPKPAPDLHIPPSNNTIKVSIIDSTTRLTMPLTKMVKPKIGDFDNQTIPTWSFFLEHAASNTKILFDLGFRKDWWNVTPKMKKMIDESGWKVDVTKDPLETLTGHGVKPEEINEIIWSHYHLDHTGDPKLFPSSTKLVVGPGFKNRFPKGWPYVEDSPVRNDAWEGRELKEISFLEEDGGGLKIGRFDAVDYFNDGSFYLLSTPGHAVGHLCGLARTTPSTFIFFGGDVAHHSGEFRPSQYNPLPTSITLNPPPTGNFDTPLRHPFPNPCLGESLLEFHRTHNPTDSFYEAQPSFNEKPEVAEWTVDGVTEFDASEDVLMALAHDADLKDVIGLYPESANEWKEKGWGERSKWRFVGNFGSAIKQN